jgi:hypothetical protein
MFFTAGLQLPGPSVTRLTYETSAVLTSTVSHVLDDAAHVVKTSRSWIIPLVQSGLSLTSYAVNVGPFAS